MSERAPIPGGAVSTVRGRWQVPALTFVTWAMLIMAILAMAFPRPLRPVLETAVVAAAIAVPILRVCWLVHRWVQERDHRFVALGLLLLAVIAAGAVIALHSYR